MTRNCQTIFGFPCLIHHLASSCILFLKIDSNKVQQKFQSQTLSKKVIFVSYSLNPFLPKTQSQMRPDQAGRQRFVTSIVNEATSQKTAETQLNDGHNLPPSPLTVGIGLTYLTKKMWRRASSVPFMLLQPLFLPIQTIYKYTRPTFACPNSTPKMTPVSASLLPIITRSDYNDACTYFFLGHV